MISSRISQGLAAVCYQKVSPICYNHIKYTHVPIVTLLYPGMCYMSAHKHTRTQAHICKHVYICLFYVVEVTRVCTI